MRAICTPLDARALTLRLEHDGAALSWTAVIAGLIDDTALRTALTDALLAAPFDALYWEARPVAPEDRDVAFESVVLTAPVLAGVQPDMTPFAVPLAGARAPAVQTFANLGGDAELVVPAPNDDPHGFPHLAAFLRRADRAQIHALWIALGQAIDRWHAARGSRVWVSTAGLGVSWLHLRLDSRPKYVKWAAYRDMR